MHGERIMYIYLLLTPADSVCPQDPSMLKNPPPCPHLPLETTDNISEDSCPRIH